MNDAPFFMPIIRKIMNEYKGVFIAFLSAGQYYGIIKVASIGVLIGFALGVYNYFINAPIVNKKLFKSDDDVDD